MSAWDDMAKAVDRIDKACDCNGDVVERCTLSVQGGGPDRAMFWVLGCEACAELRRKAISVVFGDDVKVVPWPARRREQERQLGLFDGAS